jgi:hypothetical protein
MNRQLAFLLCLGAYENHRMYPNKEGFTSDMLAYPDNEKLWHEAKQPLSLSDAIYSAIEELCPDCLDIAVDGTVFPPEYGQYHKRWAEIICKACTDIELEINFDGYSFEEARAISRNKKLFAEKLMNGDLQFGYSTLAAGERRCILTEKQVQKLAAMSVQFGTFTYFGDAHA